MISCLHGPLLGCDTKLVHQVSIAVSIFQALRLSISIHMSLQFHIFHTHGLVYHISLQVCDDYNSARHHYEEIDNNKYQVNFTYLYFRVSTRPPTS